MVDADEARRELARRELERRRGGGIASQLDDYYSSGIFAGQYNPLGTLARSLDAATTGAGDALTFGWGDEIAGLTGMDTQAIRGRRDELRESNPVASTVGAIGGGLALASTLSRVGLSAMAQGQGLGVRALAGGLEGAGLGALYGAGAGDDRNRLDSAAMGGLVGGAAGAAFPLVAAGGGRAIEAFQNWRQAGPLARQAGTTPEAARALGGIIDADGSLSAQGRQNMARAGREQMLADAGPTARRALDTAIQKSGPGGRVAREAIDARVGRDAAALTQALDDTLGPPQGVGSAQNAIRDASSPQVNQAFNRAYSTPIDYSSTAGRRVEDVVKRIPSRIARQAIQRANEQIDYDRLGRQIMADIAEDGTVVFREMPSVVQADHIKRSLDSIASDSIDPITGRMSSDGAFASRMARDLRNAVGDAVPAYREALETAADPLSRQAAVRLGSRLMSPSMTRDQVNTAVQGMTGPERQAVAQGVRSQIDDAMARVTRTVADGDTGAREAVKALRDLSSRANREKLSAVIGNDAANNLFSEVDRVAQSFDLRAAVADNSATFARQAMQDRVRDMSGTDSAVRAAQRGEGLNATRRIIQSLTGETPAAAMAREDALYAEMARLLTQQGGPGQNVYNAVTQIGQTDAATKLLTDRIVRALSGPQTSYPLSTQAPIGR